MSIVLNGTTGISTPNLDSAGTVTTTNLVNGTPLAFRNKIINGNFDIWQRGTSLDSGIGIRYLADRFNHNCINSTYSASRQTLILGQTQIPNEPIYFYRTVVTSVAGSGNFSHLGQSIENVRTLAGKTATLSFYAKADTAKPMSVEFVQFFGTGGSPSSDVSGIGVQKLNLTTSWQKFIVTANIPSITGKTIGTDTNSSCLRVIFWFDAGSNWNSRTNSLGQQSGTFDIAQVQLEEGSVATPFEQRPIGTELALCQRYYEKSYPVDVAPGTNTQVGGNGGTGMVGPGSVDGGASSAGALQEFRPFKVEKRSTPVVRSYSSTGIIDRYDLNQGTYTVTTFSPTITLISNTSFHIATNTFNSKYGFIYHYTANAEF